MEDIQQDSRNKVPDRKWREGAEDGYRHREVGGETSKWARKSLL